MNSTPLWQVVIAHRAQKLLARAAKPARERLLRAITEMGTNPFAGDILPLKGQQDSFRRRVGDWRIFFDVDRQLRRVDVTDIQRRTTTTYKQRS